MDRTRTRQISGKLGAFYLKKVAFQRLFSDEMHLNSIKKQHYPLSMHLIALQPPPAKEKEKPPPKDDAKPAIATRTNKKTNKNNDIYFYTKNINDKFNAFMMTRVNMKNGKRFSTFEFLVFSCRCKEMA
ncbi:hypothetical protein MPE84_16245 [Aeromonas veronii]|uniref:hypothetical protein n=1 Tax=Aeromonas veronii TaxID=654 RepID=UPI001FD70145|nr:hypothetical protein [Aeromonas veronii]MCJ8235811.1 hypothetical protein [Aeromonas veronii]